MKKLLNRGVCNIEPINLSNEQVIHFLKVYKTSKNELLRKDAKEMLVRANIKLVASIASKFINRGIEYHDLVYDGILGLYTAIDKYDLNKEVKLTTYAYMWILQSIQRHLNIYKEIYTPDEVCTLYGRINEVVEDYKQENGGLLPSREYIAKTLNEELFKINNACNSCKVIYSYDNVISNDNDKSFVESISDSNDIEQEIIKQEQIIQINDLLKKTLSSNEYYVLIHFFGLNDNDKMKLNDIANNLGLSQARIKQLKQQAIIKLKTIKSLQAMYC